MTTEAIRQGNNASLLRRTLQADGIFEIVCGLGMLVAAEPLSTAFGIEATLVIRGIGAGLGIVGVWMLWLANARPLNLRMALAIALINDISAIALIGLLFTNWLPLTVEGKWILGVVAVDLAILAALEFIGVRQKKD